jgi:inorganic pyrophosphatase
MADFNKILDPGDYQNGKANTVVEIPKWSTLKIEWRRDLAAFELDRVEPSIFPKPCNYGFIPQTLDEDGDELDSLIITNDPLPTGIFLKANIIGVMNFEDDGEIDHKIILVPEDDRNTGDTTLCTIKTSKSPAAPKFWDGRVPTRPKKSSPNQSTVTRIAKRLL